MCVCDCMYICMGNNINHVYDCMLVCVCVCVCMDGFPITVYLPVNLFMLVLN